MSPANLPIPEVQSAFEQLPLSFAQERQWFLWQLEPHSSAYHIPMALRAAGWIAKRCKVPSSGWWNGIRRCAPALSSTRRAHCR